MDSAGPLSGELNNSFNDLMDTEGNESGQAQNTDTGAALSGWKDLPMELLLRIMSIVADDRMVIVASGVCTGWREALGWGVTKLSLLCDAALVYLTSQCKNFECLNLCGCVRAASDRALQAIAFNCGQLQSLNLGWCDSITDKGVTSLASGCPELRALDLCGCVLITDESVVALANGCPHLRSLGLYYCQNITDRAMYSLAANSRMRSNNGHGWDAVKSDNKDGLASLNISQCTALTPPAVQAVCDSFPALHTCPERHSLIISGCLSLTSVHCACALHPHRAGGRAILSNQHAY
ncbi:hypothetical protein PR202_gb04012 [Eleusine coracana subsp. coracana]|uniref:F-box/LRR-repeat protein 15/At3g58940/PEG3-like LRR domain-containing protein n=1 Tax=Eleusine coracana subsp. coracana TaxID=191504 RepID=A0AAV5E104_ELECO|nr:hypothetical protein PR202_gb04012 [Eleusine coracana subsp. coracana]